MTRILDVSPESEFGWTCREFRRTYPAQCSSPVTHLSAVARARCSGRGSRRCGGRNDGPVPFPCTCGRLRSARPPLSSMLVSGDSLQRCRPVQGPQLRLLILSQPPTRRRARRTRPPHLHPRRAQVQPRRFLGILQLCASIIIKFYSTSQFRCM